MKIKNIVIVGAGMMGKGIAQVFSNHPDLSITLYDVADNDVLNSVSKELEQLQAHGLISDAQKRMERIFFTTDINSKAFAEADLIVECVFEDMKLKQDTFAHLEEICSETAIFATNTSVMSPTEISAKLKHKERLVGTHFWNPAYLIPLVEVVKSDYTCDEVAKETLDLLIATGKKAILCQKDVPGFIANRLQHALWREAFYMVQEGIADAATVDAACKYGPGLRWPILGPMENSDMVGIQLSYNIHEYILRHLADNHEPSQLLKEMINDGNIGFKSGKGWQEWTDEKIEALVKNLREYLIDCNIKMK